MLIVHDTMRILLLPFVLLSMVLAARAQRNFEVTIADSTYHMKQYWFVLYSRGDAAPLDSATNAIRLKAHLEHQGEQSERGLIVLAGPFGDDGDRRGIVLYDCDSKEEVEGYLKRDPYVIGGQLKYEILPWYGAVGTTLR